MGRYQRVHPILLLAIVSAASAVIVSSIFLNGDSVAGGRQNVAIAASLPFTTDLHVIPEVMVGDATLGPPYFRVEPHWMDNFGERHCEECTMIEYGSGPKRTAGAAFAADKIYDFSEAKRVVFFVMGENGGEKVSFGFAGEDIPGGSKIPADKANLILERLQFAAKTSEITLKDDWQRLEISLEGADLDKMKYPFAFQINSNDTSKVRFYVGGVFFDTEATQAPLQFEELDTTN